jgi:hypothetical protein
MIAAVTDGDFAASLQRVEFDGSSQPPGSLQQRLAGERREALNDIPGDQIYGYLAKPLALSIQSRLLHTRGGYRRAAAPYGLAALAWSIATTICET